MGSHRAVENRKEERVFRQTVAQTDVSTWQMRSSSESALGPTRLPPSLRHQCHAWANRNLYEILHR